MNVKYFADTDTMYLELSKVAPVTTKELAENLIAEMDDKGRVVALTIEHAGEAGLISGFSYELLGLENITGKGFKQRA